MKIKKSKLLTILMVLAILLAIAPTAYAVTDKYSSDSTTMVIRGNVPGATYSSAAVPANAGTYYGVNTWINQTSSNTWDPAPTWIWESMPVVNPIHGDIVWFEKTFVVNGIPTAGSLKIACDNGYAVWLNGKFVGNSATLPLFVGEDLSNNYAEFETMLGDLKQAFVNTSGWQEVGDFDLSSNLVEGNNVLTILGVNEYMNTGDASDPVGTTLLNPGGLAFSFTVDSTTPPPTYDICGFKLDADSGVGLEGWEIILKDSNGDEMLRTTTAPDGKYCFTGLAAGEYTVEEVLQSGWEPVDPASGSHSVTLPNNSIIYGIQRLTGKIFEVDPMFPNAATLYKQIVAAETNKSFSDTSPNGIAYDQETGDIYFATYPSPSRLYKFEGDVQRDLGPLTGSVASGEFYNGKYYYIADTTDDLYVVTFKADGTINAITPHMSISSDVSRWYFGDIVVDHSEGIIYGEGQNLNTNKQEFFKVNLDGSGYVRIDADVFTNLLQLAIGTDNVLYAHSAYYGTFYTIDRLTGEVAQVSDGVNLYTDISSASILYNFENEHLIEVTAKKFIDINENTLKDEGEDYASGFVFTATKGSEVRTATSDSSGIINFGMFDADDVGDWLVVEKSKLLYHQTNYLYGAMFTIANDDNILSVNWTDNTEGTPITDNIVEFGNALDKYNPGAAGTAWGGWQTSIDFPKYNKNAVEPIVYNGVYRTGSSAWAMAIQYTGEEDLTIPLIAGQYTIVGYVTIQKLPDGQVTVTYTVSPVYKLLEQHCGMYADLNEIPKNNGHLNGEMVDGVYTFDYSGGIVYITAHAVVE